MTETKMKFYLAHPLASRTDIRKHELAIEKEHKDLKLINPFYDLTRDDIKKIDQGLITRWKFKKKDCSRIVEGDVEAILDSDGILAVIDDSLSYGTILEIAYAKFAHKFVVLLNLNSTHKHPWLKYHADFIIRNWEDVYKTIKKVFDKKKPKTCKSVEMVTEKYK